MPMKSATLLRTAKTRRGNSAGMHTIIVLYDVPLAQFLITSGLYIFYVYYKYIIKIMTKLDLTGYTYIHYLIFIKYIIPYIRILHIIRICGNTTSADYCLESIMINRQFVVQQIQRYYYYKC